MQILWKGGPATAEQIREALAPKRVLKDSMTVSSWPSTGSSGRSRSTA